LTIILSWFPASNAAAAIRVLETFEPSISVVDVNLPGLSGFDLARRMLADNPDRLVIMFSMNDDPVFVAQAMAIGAKGYVSKNDNPADMVQAIHAVGGGATSWPDGTAERMAHRASLPLRESLVSLTVRDQEILRLLKRGKSLSEIADLVGVSYKTIATSCVALRIKLGARTQTELVAIAVERKLV
jgi:two-component system, NarL family, invasion response regulator UvrY